LLLLVWMLGSASAHVQSVPPSIIVSPDTGSPGAPVTVSGSGFPPGELVALYMDKEGPFLEAPGPRADPKGNFKTTVTVLPVSSGHHTICGNTTYPRSAQPVAAQACADFTVVGGVADASPSASPSPQASAAPRPSPTAFVILIAALVVVAGVTFWLVRRGD
jgi:hypothetical protein